MKSVLKSFFFFLLALDSTLFKSKILVPVVISKWPLWFGSYLMKSRSKFKKTLVIFRLDALGDYILFRNGFEKIRSNKRFIGYKIVFVGNESYKDLATTLDGTYIDKFIWLNISKLNKSRAYFYKKMYEVHLEKSEILINPHFSKTIVTEITKKYINAKYNITPLSDSYLLEKTNLQKFESDYQERIKVPKNISFEIDKNFFFLGKILNCNFKSEHFVIDLNKEDSNEFGSFIMIFPGAGLDFRMWNVDNYKLLIQHILENTDYEIIISGSRKECKIGEYLHEKFINNNRVRNWIGSKSLTDVTRLIDIADLVVGNESAPIHISAACRTPFICISNGNHFGRFNPYPNKYVQTGFYVYPSEIKYDSKYMDSNLIERFKIKSNIDIDQVNVKDVISIFDIFRNNQYC